MSSLEHGKGAKKAGMRGAAKPKPALDPAAAARARTGNSSSLAVSPEERYAMIARVAYFRAAGRGFCPGCELDDWLAAEAEVEERIASR